MNLQGQRIAALEKRINADSEQYLLAAFLLGGGNRFEVELPAAFVDDDPKLSAVLEPVWEALGLPERLPPSSFWLRIRERAAD